MRRYLIALAALMLPGAASGQWTVSVGAGIHADRLAQPERVLTGQNSRFMMSSPGEAPVISLRATRWLNEFGIEAGLGLAQNRSWSGNTSTPVPDFAKRTLFTHAAGIWRPLSPERSLQIRIGAGPAAIVHGGTGESALSRNVDVGIMATAGVSWRATDNVRFGVDVNNYRFTSKFKAQTSGTGWPTDYRSGSYTRSEWLVLPALTFRF